MRAHGLRYEPCFLCYNACMCTAITSKLCICSQFYYSSQIQRLYVKCIVYVVCVCVCVFVGGC